MPELVNLCISETYLAFIDGIFYFLEGLIAQTVRARA